MTNKEAVNWLINVMADIGKFEHRDLWHYEQALMEIREMLESAQPERIKGHWINGHCDKCNEHAPFWCMASTYHKSNFCPNCGAKMEG